MLTTSALALSLSLSTATLLPTPQEPAASRAQAPAAPASEATWLERSQGLQGSWAGDAQVSEVGTTALTLLALLGEGVTTGAGPQRQAVARGAAWLSRQGDPESDLWGASGDEGAGLLEHAWATLALSELVVLDATLEAEALGQPRAAAALLGLQRSDGSFGDWRTTGWCLFALSSAREAGASVPKAALERGLVALRKATPIPTRPRLHQAGELTMRAFLGRLGGSPDVPAEAALGRVLEAPGALLALDPEQRLLTSYAAYQAGGPTWKTMAKALREQHLPLRHKEGPRVGSFPAEGGCGALRATALGQLTQAVVFRYARVIGSR